MIRRIRASDPRFKTVELGPGLNVLLADTTEESTEHDTRNGVGKTLLMQILHFCLGGSAPRTGGLADPQLSTWTFTLDIDLYGGSAEVSRSLTGHQTVTVAGNFDRWPVTPTQENGSPRLTIDEWKTVLGDALFGLATDIDTGHRYRPSFRAVVSYFARVGAGAYETPFKFFSGQREWQKQVNVAFLLDLSWPDASRYQELKDQREALRTLKRAVEQGALGDPEQTLGRLRTSRVQLVSSTEQLEAQLQDFEVHPEYREIAAEADGLTTEIHDRVNGRVIRQRQITMYEEQAASETVPEVEALVALFEQAGVELSEDVRRTLDEAQDFHLRVVANRRDYLRDEIEALRAQNEEVEREIEALSSRRADLLDILETKHALDELHRLNERLAEFRAQLSDVDSQIARIEEIDERQARLEIDAQELGRSSRRELSERETEWREVIELFASNTEALYASPGELVIDLGDNGFSFDVEIDRSGSRGVNNMKIFAFDLMLAQRWAAKPRNPGFLWHDSELFDGVDERQVGAALQLAAHEAETRGFQYFCSLNTDALPSTEFLGDLDLEPVLTLTDASEDGALFGMRF